jgi:hypothetical protein
MPGAVTIAGPGATTETVGTALDAHAIAHFACHSVSDWNAPATSHANYSCMTTSESC